MRSAGHAHLRRRGPNPGLYRASSEERPGRGVQEGAARDGGADPKAAQSADESRLARVWICPEAKLTLDPTTKAPIDVTRRTSDPGIKRAYNMIEELMLLANELVATWLGNQKSPAIYRVHGKPRFP